MKGNGERNNGGRGGSSHDATTLSDLGISRDQSSKWQALAQVPKIAVVEVDREMSCDTTFTKSWYLAAERRAFAGRH